MLLDDLVTLVDAQTALTDAVDLFAGGFYDEAGAPDTQAALYEYSGLPPHHVLGSTNAPIAVLPRVQVACRSSNYATARTLAQTIYDVVANLTHQTLSPSGKRYIRVEALQEPFDMGRDENHRNVIGFNLQITRDP